MNHNDVIKVPIEGSKRCLWNVRKNGVVLGIQFRTQRLAFSYLAHRMTKREMQRVLTATPIEHKLQLDLFAAQWKVRNLTAKWILVDGKLVLGEEVRAAAKAEVAALKAQLNELFEARTGLQAKTETECKKSLATALKAAKTRAKNKTLKAQLIAA